MKHSCDNMGKWLIGPKIADNFMTNHPQLLLVVEFFGGGTANLVADKPQRLAGRRLSLLGERLLQRHGLEELPILQLLLLAVAGFMVQPSTY